MKPRTALMLTGLAGFACGLGTGEWNTAFMPSCGEDCGSQKMGVILLVSCIVSLVFIIAGAISKSWRTYTLLLMSIIVLSLVAVLASYGLYEYRSLRHLSMAETAQLLVDQDYSNVATATQSVPELGLSQGDLCSLGTSYCNENPRYIEAHCAGGVVKITENAWSLFTRLPERDYPGIEPEQYKDFPKKVCSTANEGN
jgi:hypothetical protein